MPDLECLPIQRACIPRSLLQVIEKEPEGAEDRKSGKKTKDKSKKRRHSSKGDRVEAETAASEAT